MRIAVLLRKDSATAYVSVFAVKRGRLRILLDLDLGRLAAVAFFVLAWIAALAASYFLWPGSDAIDSLLHVP